MEQKIKIAVDPNDKTKKILLYSNDENIAGHFKQVMERESTGKSPDDVLRNIIDKYLKMDAYAKKTILFDKKYGQLEPMIKFLEEDSKYKLEPMAKGIYVKYLQVFMLCKVLIIRSTKINSFIFVCYDKEFLIRLITDIRKIIFYFYKYKSLFLRWSSSAAFIWEC